MKLSRILLFAGIALILVFATCPPLSATKGPEPEQTAAPPMFLMDWCETAQVDAPGAMLVLSGATHEAGSLDIINATDKTIGVDLDPLYRAIVMHCPSNDLTFTSVAVTAQDAILTYLGQDKPDEFTVTRFKVSAESEETMNAGLIGALYLTKYWSGDLETLKREVFNAESYGLTLYYAITNASYDEYRARMTELGRQAIGEEWYEGMKQRLQEESGLVDLPLYNPYP